jgi:hypothetical protein
MSFPIIMILVLMVGALGVAALTMSRMENSMAGSMRMMEEGTAAAESCIGTAVEILKDTMLAGSVQPRFQAALGGPVPAAVLTLTGQEMSAVNANNPDSVVTSPNLIMQVNNYAVTGDVDFQFRRLKPGSGHENIFRVECLAINAATGTTSHVIAEYDCLVARDGCFRRSY